MSNANIIRPAPLSRDVMSLSWKETLALFKALNSGTVGFDYGQYRLADLRNVLSSWIAQGVPAAVIDGHAQTIIAARARATPANVPPPQSILAPLASAQDIAAAQALAPSPADLAARAESLRAHLDAEHAARVQGVVTLPPIADVPATQGIRDAIRDAIAQAQAAQQAAHVAQMAPQPQPFAASVIVDEIGPDAMAIHAAPETPTEPPLAPIAAPVALAQAPAGMRYAHDIFADQSPAVVDAVRGLLIPVYAHADAEQPKLSYRFTPDSLTDACIAMATPQTARIWCGGARGTGKTEFVRQLAARTGRALYRVNVNRFTEAADLIGDMGLKAGETVWQDGPIAKALRDAATGAGVVILIDEITYGSAGAVACLNPLLEQDGAALRLPRTGEALPIPPHAFIAVCDNTFGAGSDNSEYPRNELGADVRDRFQYKLMFDFLPEADEKALLRDAIVAASGKKPQAAMMSAIMKLLKTCRAKSDAGELQGAPSYRGAVAFATLLAFGRKPAHAWTVAVVLGAPESSHEALRLVFSSVWPSDSTGNLTALFN